MPSSGIPKQQMAQPFPFGKSHPKSAQIALNSPYAASVPSTKYPSKAITSGYFMPPGLIWCLFYIIFRQLKSPFTNLLQSSWQKLDRQAVLSIGKVNKIL